MKRLALAAALLALSACASGGGSPSSNRADNPNLYGRTAAPAPTTVTHAIQGRETARGTFVGLGDHATSGHASVFRANGKWYISLADDFSFDGAPDPKVAFGSNGFRQEAILTRLTANTGASVYEVPATLDVGDYNEIWLWCEQFGVPLGVARLTLT